MNRLRKYMFDVWMKQFFVKFYISLGKTPNY